MRISDWSSDVCSSDLPPDQGGAPVQGRCGADRPQHPSHRIISLGYWRHLSFARSAGHSALIHLPDVRAFMCMLMPPCIGDVCISIAMSYVPGAYCPVIFDCIRP